jgi:hypothetical protein
MEAAVSGLQQLQSSQQQQQQQQQQQLPLPPPRAVVNMFDADSTRQRRQRGMDSNDELNMPSTLPLHAFVDDKANLEEEKLGHAVIRGGFHPMTINQPLYQHQYQELQSSPKSLSGNEPSTYKRILQLDQAMERSMKSQRLIQEWDSRMGLRRCHSKTMRQTNLSRRKVQELMVSTILRGGGLSVFVPKQA